jgi:hypothetical protein
MNTVVMKINQILRFLVIVTLSNHRLVVLSAKDGLVWSWASVEILYVYLCFNAGKFLDVGNCVQYH